MDLRLKKILREQYNFLRKSCSEFDKGDKSEAKRIAVTLRVLAHNTSNSKSLISQLEEVGNVKVKILSKNIGFASGLKYYVGASIRFKNGISSYEPMMDLTHPGLRPINIDTWWEQGILLINEVPFTRKDIMLSLVNKEGGAHVDPIQDVNFRRLTEGDLMLLRNSQGEGIEGIELILARENGFYMMKCIENSFNSLLN
jgi:hypothetical protein